MEKQTIIRSAAIVVAAIAASTFGAQHLLGDKQAPSAQASSPSQSAQIVGAGLLGNTSRTTPEPAPSLKVEEASFAALSDGPGPVPIVESGSDFVPKLALADDSAGHDTAFDCTPRLVSRPAIDALIELSLDAPCHANERLVISHDDLAFSAYTSDTGSFSAYIPALSADAKIDVFLSEDVFLQSEVQIEDVEAHARVIVQWTGEAEFALHAYHRGAQFGEDGHIHALKPFDADLDEAFLISLGEKRGPEPMLAEIYSSPAHLVSGSKIELELRFTAQQCGQDLSVYILTTGTNVSADVKEAGFAMPDCPAESGTVVMELQAMAAPQHAEAPSQTGLLLTDLHD